MSNLRIGFIGLGNVGGPLAGNLLRHGIELTVRDLDPQRVASLVERGARAASSPRELAAGVDLVITCLPSPAVSAQVMEQPDGVLAGLAPGKIWLEMSTTDHAEARRLAARVEERGATALDCPVSGGCHRAATGNISIFAGGTRAAFERVLPVLSTSASCTPGPSARLPCSKSSPTTCARCISRPLPKRLWSRGSRASI